MFLSKRWTWRERTAWPEIDWSAVKNGPGFGASVENTLAERLEGNGGEGVLHTRQALDLLRDEMVDISAVWQIAFHHHIVLRGGRMDLGNRIAILGHRTGNPISLTKRTFLLNKDCSDGQNCLGPSRQRLISSKIREPAVSATD
jgi:hypothetical protein